MIALKVNQKDMVGEEEIRPESELIKSGHRQYRTENNCVKTFCMVNGSYLRLIPPRLGCLKGHSTFYSFFPPFPFYSFFLLILFSLSICLPVFLHLLIRFKITLLYVLSI